MRSKKEKTPPLPTPKYDHSGESLWRREYAPGIIQILRRLNKQNRESICAAIQAGIRPEELKRKIALVQRPNLKAAMDEIFALSLVDLSIDAAEEREGWQAPPVVSKETTASEAVPTQSQEAGAE